MTSFRKTPIYNQHVAMNAKLVPFSGWHMPVQYEGILAEHKVVRDVAGIFDVSHMGRFQITGRDAIEFINYITVNDVERLEPFCSQYTLACRENGGIIDDFLVYRLPDKILIVPNAGNSDKLLKWLQKIAISYEVEIQNLTEQTVLFALQGPKSELILNAITKEDLRKLTFQSFTETWIEGIKAKIFRTGYTGEDGFEIWCSAECGPELWSIILKSGIDRGLKACGLGARDTLRLEAGLALYGHEIDESINPIEAGLGWVVKFKKPKFIGRNSLLSIREKGLTRKLVALKVLERGIPRQGYDISYGGNCVGQITSGAIAPTLGYGIGTGYVPISLTEPGTILQINIRDKKIPAVIVKQPFYVGSRK